MNSKEEQTNSETTNLGNESSLEKQSEANYINEQTEDNTLDGTPDDPRFKYVKYD